MSSTVEQIKSRLDVVEVIGTYVKLESAGTNLKARCPFHSEKTPSFFVSPSRQSFHCFGCGKGGDIVSFVEEIEGTDFAGALKTLADRAGIKITTFDRKKATEAELQFNILEKATQFFEARLKEEQEAIDYLKKRGLSGKTAKEFRVGYARDSWNSLHAFLRGEKFSDAQMEKVGLVVRGDKGYYDRFRGRIMFPIADISGRVIGFSGRLFGGEEENRGAKYVNTPATDLYDKSRVLYGFDKARLEIKREDACILVEGQMDLLMSHQAGAKNTVAVSGTALTEGHLKIIKRFTDNLVFAFDPDAAGIKASARGINSALSLGMDVHIVTLPDGRDPAELILDDSARWKELVGSAKHVIDYYLELLSSQGHDKRTLGLNISETVLPYIAALSGKMRQAYFVSEVARMLQMTSEDPIWEELKKKESIIRATGAKNKNNEQDKKAREQEILATITTRKELVERKIIGIILWQDEMKKPSIDVKYLRTEYAIILGAKDISHIASIAETEQKERIFEAEAYYDGTEDMEAEVRELLHYFREEVLKEEFSKTMMDLKKAEHENDKERSIALLAKCQDISKKINALK
ncbi:MAG: DNA primase [Candidatus Yonathbacteria bacterium CG_4_10_14_3_um_filter_47_65]|uniref:DNA primase n=2 Tax=Parcubacteria group TaxID=1794811 RepID=A0A2M8D6G3_9BACT|nr:MAG: DNA primase [Candidatus Nomurabacteria bacterium CG1_02_47_685]PIP04034.1 MAG: DNA primase [Candidatus Yonathbacteria bacterium CG23_combo_of_CG06-09_8_20_14_all_46_18]PIQ32219.1 MAG: DNA primase [Candidatus Yonathbacteria bacterium CG17_big_fil_post_rev_8_21_14_2_50_46_19]PIX56682.1 MAG: DNA primase [Candidatus Yonathbacteria bacterium CG_4_10_14_3_um_filter_47_65]PIY57875.1 MAG: DNA primase [Candidatus Yonathbacteria bacterium CG_4_10_14_0_8_um_filter_47_645]PJB82503.1 MAG: DNA prima